MQERKNFRKLPEKRCFYREKTFKKNRFCKGLVLPGKTCYDNNRKIGIFRQDTYGEKEAYFFGKTGRHCV